MARIMTEPAFPPQQQNQQPGIEAAMMPRPGIEEAHYRAAEKLQGKIAFVTDGEAVLVPQPPSLGHRLPWQESSARLLGNERCDRHLHALTVPAVGRARHTRQWCRPRPSLDAADSLQQQRRHHSSIRARRADGPRRAVGGNGALLCVPYLRGQQLHDGESDAPERERGGECIRRWRIRRTAFPLRSIHPASFEDTVGRIEPQATSANNLSQQPQYSFNRLYSVFTLIPSADAVSRLLPLK